MAYYWGEDWILAQQLAKDGKYADEIAIRIGRSEHAVRKRFELMGVPLPQKRRGPAPQTPKREPIQVAQTQRIVPDDVERDREARYRAALRLPPAQTVFGDPLPGWSALDRKRRNNDGAQS
jgi:hypothetical protein